MNYSGMSIEDIEKYIGRLYLQLNWDVDRVTTQAKSNINELQKAITALKEEIASLRGNQS